MYISTHNVSHKRGKVKQQNYYTPNLCWGNYFINCPILIVAVSITKKDDCFFLSFKTVS